jgi:Phosphotransferase enzyme family
MTPPADAIPVRDLLARASARESVAPSDGKGGAAFERVTVDGMTYFVKRQSRASDWIMRVTGDEVHRPYLVWQAGIMNRAPGCIDHTVVAMDLDGTGDQAVLTMVMRDVGRFLVPPGDTVIPAGQHQAFIAHMAALAAAFWGWDDDLGLTTMAQRLQGFAPGTIAAELTGAEVPGPLAAAAAGWAALPGRSPVLWQLARLVHDRPEVITGPLAQTPRTFLHGDWKMGNLGSHPDGRTILLDWTLPGSGPACFELCWYLALNRARLPEPKEAVISRFRGALEECGIDTAGWWQAQLDLCLIGITATFAWEKALGDADELAWWQNAAAEAADRQGIATTGPTDDGR